MSQRGRQLFGKTLFVDLLLGMLVIVTSTSIALSALEKAKVKKALENANSRLEGEFAAQIEWDDESKDDVDLYVRDPAGNICYFGATDIPLMAIDHDDQGTVTDTLVVGSGQVVVKKNSERVVIRGFIPGEYVVNAHMFTKRDPDPMPVHAQLIRLKGGGTVLADVTKVLERGRDEVTLFRFTVSDSGSVLDINDLQIKLVGRTARGARGF